MRIAKVLTLVVALAGTALVGSQPALAQSEDIQEGDKAFEDGKLDKAAKKYDAAIRSGPSTVPPVTYAKRAAIFFLEKQPEAGLEFIEKRALAQYPGDPDILTQKVVMLWDLNRKKEAIQIADKVSAKQASSYQVQLIRGAYYFRRDPAKAADAYDKYLKHRPSELSKDDALPRLRLGIMYLATGDNSSAESQFELVSKRFRANRQWSINADNGLCAAYTANGKFDRAITLCERIVENPTNIDRKGSVWFNLGQAYLFKKQPRKARQAGIEFTRYQKGNPKGYMLIGDAYFEERNWEQALYYYNEAEKRSQGDKRLLMKMGQTYRRMGKPALALPRLEAAYSQRPNDPEIAMELGETYLHEDVREDTKALSAVSKLLEANPKNDALHYVAGRALYNQGKLAQAKTRFLEAYELRENESKYAKSLIETINRQAADAYGENNLRQAEKHLSDAYAYDKGSAMTNRNLAVLYLDRGACDKAQDYLRELRKSRRDQTLAHRLTARAYLCQNKPNAKASLDHYEKAAEGTSGSRGNKLLRAEIYAEMAPLIMQADLEKAIDRLEEAANYAGNDANIGPAIQRNLALALFRRGWANMRARGRDQAAVADFERATRNPSLLRGAERPAFEFSLALAYLEVGNTGEARKLFDSLAKQGNQGAYLKAPYDKVGAQFFSAYAEYRTSTLRARRSAAEAFARLQRGAKGGFSAKLRELVASAWEFVAFEEFQAGRGSAAQQALTTAARYATTASSKRSIEHNKAALNMKNAQAAAASFRSMGASPPEALVNLGIAYDRLGKSREAYDAWVQARAKGVRVAKLEDWISAKKRIFGY